MKFVLVFPIILFLAFGSLSAQGLVFQDTTFTDPVFITDETEFVTFQNCRFLDIVGDALTINKSGAVILGCRFENIAGSGIVLDSSEIYLLNDTLTNIVGDGVYAGKSTVVIQDCNLRNISQTALYFLFCDLIEVSTCDLSFVGDGISCLGPVEGLATIFSTKIYGVLGVPAQPNTGNAISLSELGLVAIESCTIDSCLGFGINLENIGAIAPEAESVVIQGNKISKTKQLGIQGIDAANAIIRGNEISYPGYGGGFASCIWWAGADARIEDNHLHHAFDSTDVHGYGIWVLSTATVARNHIHDCSKHGIRYSPLGSMLGLVPVLVLNNVVHDVGRHPLFYEGEGLNSPNVPAEVSIRNNTLLAKSSGNLALNAPFALCCTNAAVSLQGNILIYDGVTDTSEYISATNGTTLSESLNLKVPGDIDFVDYAGRNFHLNSTNSPAYDFLPLNFGLPNDDFDGTPRIGRHDAGAFELANSDSICGCTNCPLGIPDLSFGDYIYSVRDIANNNLASPSQGVCGVRVQFGHEYLGDIRMDLISPSGQSVQLMGPTGFFNATDGSLWDIGFTTCNGAASPDPGFTALWSNDQNWGTGANYTGIYYPSNGCLEEFNNGTVTGDWTLRVFDNQVSDTGIVRKFEMLFCDMTNISCQPCSQPPQANLMITPVGAWSVNIQNLTTGGVLEYQISYGDGFSGLGHSIPTLHTYADTGNFLIRLIALNECGADTFEQFVHIQGAPPIAFVTADPTTGCAPLEVQLGAAFSSDVQQWHWLCPGATPAESFDAEPLVTYATPGIFPITAIVSNNVGADTLLNVITIEVQAGLVNPSFITQVVGDSIICINTTQNAESFHWSIDNGSPVGLNTSPQIFEVPASGDYTIALTLSNPCETSVVLNTVTVIISESKWLEKESWQFTLSPNPNDGRFNLAFVSPENTEAQLTILNALGAAIYGQSLQVAEGRNTLPIQMENLSAGLYNLRFQTENGATVLRFVVE